MVLNYSPTPTSMKTAVNVCHRFYGKIIFIALSHVLRRFYDKNEYKGFFIHQFIFRFMVVFRGLSIFRAENLGLKMWMYDFSSENKRRVLCYIHMKLGVYPGPYLGRQRSHFSPNGNFLKGWR